MSKGGRSGSDEDGRLEPALLIAGAALARGRPADAFPAWLLVTMVLLGPAGLLLLVAWVLSHRIAQTPAR